MKSFVKYIAILLIIQSPLLLRAAGSESAGDIWTWALNNIILIIGLLVIVGAVISIINLIYGFLEHQKIQTYKELGLEIPKAKSSGESFWSKLNKMAWRLVPIEKESDIDLGHEFDGIRELDNRLPPWWVYLFYITIVWAGIYIYVNHFSDYAQSQTEEYYAIMKQAELDRIDYLMKMANSVDETNVVALTEVADLQEGAKIYQRNCIACHGMSGEGGVGPNLTDEYWIHGNEISDIFKTVKYGVIEKGMQPWGKKLMPSAIQKVGSYVLTLQGTNPPNGKKAEGVKIEN